MIDREPTREYRAGEVAVQLHTARGRDRHPPSTDTNRTGHSEIQEGPR